MFFKRKTPLYDKDFLFGFALILGTITGVGLFSIPYIALKTSFVTIVGYFIVIGFMMALLHHFYAEISIHSKKSHHLPGHAENYIGPWAKNITAISEGVGLMGAQLAYLIVGGSFLARLVGLTEGGFETFFIAIFFLAGSLLLLKGVKAILETELVMLGFFIAIITLFFGYSLFGGDFNPLSIGENGNIFLPYGVIVFSLYGVAAMPELTSILKKQERKINRIIFWSLVSAVIIDIVFAWTILSISGPGTTPETFQGLEGLIPNALFKGALLFGVITVFTSFLAVGLGLKKMFMDDYNVPEKFAFFLSTGVPFVLYLLGFDNFLTAVSISGSIGLSISGIIIFIIFIRLKKEREKRNPEERVIHHPFFTHTGFILLLILLAAFGGIASIVFELIN